MTQIKILNEEDIYLKKFNIELGKSNLYNTSYFWIGDGMSLSIRK